MSAAPPAVLVQGPSLRSIPALWGLPGVLAVSCQHLEVALEEGATRRSHRTQERAD